MGTNVTEEVRAWFAERGFDLVIAEDGGVWWANLASLSDEGGEVRRYGRGDSADAAALRARKRYEQEQ